MDTPIRKKIDAEINRLRPAMVDVLAELAGIPAISPASGGEGEVRKADRLESYYRQAGLAGITRHDAPSPAGPRPNIVARTFGSKRGAGRLWVVSHLDVVPPGDLSLWKSEPFRPELKNGKLFGRGTEDNGQALVASFFALKALANLGLEPGREIMLAAVSDEETGSRYGMTHLLESGLGRKNDAFLVTDGGSRDGALVEIAEKAIYWLRFETLGRQGHGSMPDRAVNAMEAASALVCRLPELRRRFDLADALFDPPVSTFTPTMRAANVPNVNTIPGRDVFCLDCRILPACRLAEVDRFIRRLKGEVEAAYGVKIRVSVIQKSAGSQTDRNEPLVTELARVVGRELGVLPRPGGIGAGTCAAFPRHAGFPAVAWGIVNQTGHQPNEYATAVNLAATARVLAHFFREFT